MTPDGCWWPLAVRGTEYQPWSSILTLKYAPTPAGIRMAEHTKGYSPGSHLQAHTNHHRHETKWVGDEVDWPQYCCGRTWRYEKNSWGGRLAARTRLLESVQYTQISTQMNQSDFVSQHPWKNSPWFMLVDWHLINFKKPISSAGGSNAHFSFLSFLNFTTSSSILCTFRSVHGMTPWNV